MIKKIFATAIVASVFVTGPVMAQSAGAGATGGASAGASASAPQGNPSSPVAGGTPSGGISAAARSEPGAVSRIATRSGRLVGLIASTGTTPGTGTTPATGTR
ncbi:putative lipoprotein [Thioalkalivibrio sp. K90mix]|uniref:hypothetical protein n=1 Tax=unclassified Thioalkalivibrio TaxID=2621013 RepID=UPI000195A3FD|nr:MULTISPECIES: hypothetical protein [unclassified Thioalkalivibrio]ADC71140.1 putative lipoprotein [Thioalkalivibrio sp. K90mix]